MARRARWSAVLLACALSLGSAPSHASRKVTWARVEVREGGDAGRVAANLKELLQHASLHTKWGKGNDIELSARVTDLHWQASDDVLKITVTVVARIAGGKSARAHIRLGGRPTERRKLEKQALRIVAEGLVTRLSDLARR